MKKNWKIFLILAILIIVVYANSLNNVFLSDDIPSVVDNPHIGTFKWPGPAFLRSYINDVFFNLWGLNPVPYRTLNILFHLGCTWLVFTLINFMSRKKSLAFWAAAIFAIHPVLAEPIIWISGGLYPQYSFFVLLGLWLYILKDKNKKYYYFSLLSFLGALLSSEKAIIFPLIILLWELCFGKLKETWKKIAPYFVISAGWAIIYLSRIFQRFSDLQTWHYESPTTYNPLLQIPIAISSYFELIFWPEKLTIYHTEMGFLVWGFILRTILVILFIGLIVFLFVYKKSAVRGLENKKRQLAFWLTFFVIILLPTLTPLNLAWIVAERYVYLGAVGIIFVALWFIYNLVHKYYDTQKIFYIICILLVIGLSTRTIIRNVDWKNQDNLWFATAKVSPSGPNIHNNLGDVYGRRGDKQRAIQEFLLAIQINPHYADAMHNVANTYVETGQIQEAIYWYTEAIKNNPYLWQSYINLGAIYFNSKEYDKARGLFEKALELQPNNEQIKKTLEVISNQ